MAIVVKNTNYNGEVLESILTVATTGNELVSKGLIMVIPGVEKKMSIPRLKAGKMLQKQKVNPTLADSKGDFNYSEHSLDPKDFMAFTTFNPRAFEHIWRKWQPKGNLVFSELPPEAQNALLEALSKQVQFELGWHYVNGKYGDGDDELLDGILTQASKDKECIVVESEGSTMLDILRDVRGSIPKAMRENPNLRILMSVDDFDRYDDELTQREYKNSDETEVNRKRYKGIAIETISSWPDSVIVATLCSPDSDGNLFAAVNLQDDESVIQIDKFSNAGELYFFKLLMKADTNIGFGEEFVVYDGRDEAQFKPEVPTISGEQSISAGSEAGSETKTYTASNGAKITAKSDTDDWLTVSVIGNEVTFNWTKNETGGQRTGKATVGIEGKSEVTLSVTVTQEQASEAA